MNLKFGVAAIFLIFLSLARPVSQDAPQPQQLIQATNAATDLRTLRPYTVQATIVVKPGTKEEKRGRLTIFQDKDRSRTEVEFGSYRELKIVLGNREYVGRNAQAPPVELHEMADVLHLWHDAIAPSDELSPSFVKESDGVQATCVEVTEVLIKTRAGFARPREVVRHCFDPNKKVLLQVVSTRQYKGKLTWETHYLNYQTISGVQFPSAIRHFALDKPAGVDFEDIHLGSLNPDLVDFSPLQNALEFETCDDPKPARMVEVIDPSYPQMAKIAHVQGDVYFSAVLGKDGALQDIKVVSGHPILVQAALDAVRQWRYAPTTCGSTPVGVETGIVVRFHMD